MGMCACISVCCWCTGFERNTRIIWWFIRDKQKLCLVITANEHSSQLASRCHQICGWCLVRIFAFSAQCMLMAVAGFAVCDLCGTTVFTSYRLGNHIVLMWSSDCHPAGIILSWASLLLDTMNWHRLLTSWIVCWWKCELHCFKTWLTEFEQMTIAVKSVMCCLLCFVITFLHTRLTASFSGQPL